MTLSPRRFVPFLPSRPTLPFRSSLPLLSGLLLSAAALVAQGTADPSAPPADQNVIELGRFEVSTDKDNGYMAADTISSGRLATNLLLTPSDTSVITRDLLNDLAVFNLEEATGWLTNSRPTELGAIESNSISTTTMDSVDYGGSGTLRGMSTQPATRNYFPSGTVPMEYNVERVEGARGPNAILYGEGGPGGQINYLTKKAKSRNFGSLRVRADSEGSMGFAIDVNRAIGRSAALRYNGSWFDGQGWQSRVQNNHVGNALSLVFHPVEGMTLSIDADKSRTYRSLLISAFTDSSSNWNRIPLNGRLTTNTSQTTAAGLTNLGSNATKYRVYTEGLGIVDWKGYGQTSGTGLTLVPGLDRSIVNIPEAPDRRFTTNPDDAHVTAVTHDVSAAIEQRFRNDFIVEFAGAYAKNEQDGANYRYSQTFVDPNTRLPDGSPNPNFLKMYSATNYGKNLDGTMRDMKALRLAANYPFRLFGGVQNVSVIAQRQETHSLRLQSTQRIVDNPSAANPITATGNQLYVFRYWDNMPSSLPDLSKVFEFRNVPDIDSSVRRDTDSLQIGTSGSYLRNRLSIIGGFRRDDADLYTADGILSTRDPITGAIGDYTRANYRTSNDSISGGVVFFPIESVGVYANFSDGFSVQTNANPRIDGSFAEVGIVPSSVTAYGVRLRLFNGKLIASAGTYHARESDSFMTVNVTNINNIWRNHPGNSDKLIGTFSRSPEVITDTQSREGWGWEAEMTANVSNSLRFTANLALPNTNQSNVGQGFRDYVAKHLPTWEKWAADPTSPTQQATDILNLTGVKNTIANFQDGRAQNNTYNWRANVFGTYFVRSTFLRGARIGLGAQFFGPRVIGNQPNDPYNYIYSSTYQIFTGTLGRQFKIRASKLDLQLNVVNLLNYGQPIIQGVFNYQGTPVPYAYKYLAPRTVRLTATLSF